MNQTHTLRSAVRLTIAALVASAIGALVLAPHAHAFPGDNGDIVYQRYFKGGSEIFSLDPETGTEDRLTSRKIKSGNSIAAGDPAYSANGRKVVFTNAVKTPGPGARRNNLFLMRADGARPRRLLRSEYHQSAPAFSPDGSTIAFSERGDVWAIAPDGSDKRNLTADLPGGGASPVFSPDGTRIALTSGEGGDGDVFLVDLDGSNPVNLTAGSPDAEYQPAFSPDGTRIAFASDRLDYRGDLFVMDVDGSDVQPVTSNPGVEHYDPAFSPDGSKLVYSSRKNSRGAIDVFMIDVAGGPATAVPGIGGAVAQNPDWGVATP